MSTELLDIQPRELKFTFELKKQSSCSVRLVNKTNSPVAFKVKTTSPKKYCVRPNVGIVEPKSACDFTVTMQAQRVAPPDLICKDKFLVQCTVVPEGTSDDDIVSSMFSKDDKKYVEENKLKVVLVSPPQSPVLSPINGVHKQMADHEAPVLEDQVFSSIQFISPQKKKSIEDISLQKSDSIEEPTLPNKSNSEDISLQNIETSEDITLQNNKYSDDISLQNNETIKEITLPNNKQREDISLPKNEAIKDITLSNNEHSEDISAQNNETIKDITLANNEHSEDISAQKTETVKYVSLQKNETIEDISLQKNDTIEDISLPNNNNIEDIRLQKKVAQVAKESKMGTCEELVGAESVEFGRMKDVEDLELVKDIYKMKSKLNELESKLSEAEVMISKLTEEKRLSTQERESLRKELGALKSRTGGMRKVQVGFPLLFVVTVALISIVLGYLSRC